MSVADVPGTVKADRQAVRDAWVARATDLIDRVEGWVRELDWPTRRVTKTIDDPTLGPYDVPALAFQGDFTRLLLEPMGHEHTGGDAGSAELYQLPFYDDVMRFYHENGRWTYYPVHPGLPGSRKARRPLTREALHDALERLRRRASEPQ